jgi:hypothetical protein
MLRYSAVPADQARLEMLLWVFGGQSLFGVFVAFPTFALTMLRPALDPYVRVQLFLDSLFAIGSLVIALCLPYLLFDSSIRGAVRLLPGDIDSIYWLIGVLCALFTVFFMIGDFAYNAQRKELLKKSDRWLHELETAQLLDVKSDFRRERSINARLEAPRMIAELISDDVYLAGFWVWRYEKARQGLEAFADRVIAAKPLDITDGSAEPLDDEVREQKSNQIAIADQRPNGSLTWWRTLIPGGKIRSAERPIEITERFRLEVKRSMGFLFGGKSLIYTGVAQTFGKLFSDNQMALARWNPRLLFLIGYTELMFVPEQRERVLEIIEDLKTNIVFLRSEPNRALRGALTLSFSSSALLTSIVELVKILALKWS